MNTTLGTIIVSFFRNHLRNEKNCRPNTIASYSDNMRILLNFCSSQLNTSIENLTMEDISDSLVLDYLDYLTETRGNSPNTCNQRLTLVKSFSRYLARQEPEFLVTCQRICAIQLKKTSHKIIQGLDVEEVETIIDAPDTTTINGARDHALLLLMHNTGARVQEVCDLRIRDLTQGKLPQVLLTGKGGKQRVTPLWTETSDAIMHYLGLRGAPAANKEEQLFLNARGNKLSRFGIGYLVKKYTTEAFLSCPELKGKIITPHTFRHTTALHLIQSGVDIVIVKEWLGHADIKTTMQYLEIDIKMKQAALLKCPPPISTLRRTRAEWQQASVMAFLKGLCKVKLC